MVLRGKFFPQPNLLPLLKGCEGDTVSDVEGYAVNAIIKKEKPLMQAFFKTHYNSQRDEMAESPQIQFANLIPVVTVFCTAGNPLILLICQCSGNIFALSLWDRFYGP